MKEERREELIKNVMRLNRLGRELGIFVKEVEILRYYLEPFENAPEDKVAGVKINPMVRF